ncbi:MAG: hypothetical protein RBR32_07300 [Bacteroidales bacterium]|nr:hypothetical protein [Bacteroidales bacterium]
MASRISLRSMLEGKQPLITRIYTNYGFSHFASLNARREKFLLAVLSAGEISRKAELRSKRPIIIGRELGFEFSACFVMIFAINSKNPAKTPLFLQNKQPHYRLYVNS